MITSIIDISIIIISVTGLFFEMFQKPVFWILYIAAAVLLGYEFWLQKLFASSILQIAYIGLSIWGLYEWSKIDNKTHKHLTICHTNIKQWCIYITTTFIMAVILFHILKYFGDSDSLVDAILTSISLTATYMAIFKQIESWFVFAATVFISAPLYFKYNLYFTAITYIIYGVLDFIGGIKWIIDFNKNC